MEGRIEIQIVRDAERGVRQSYRIRHWEGMTVLEALHQVWTEQDPSLAYVCACRAGTCTGCLVDLNGKTVLACRTPVSAAATIAPARGRRVIRDVVTSSES